MRRLIVSLVVTFAAVVLLTASALAVARRLPLSPEIAMLHLADCPPPCWIGIVPGQTTLGMAKQRLSDVFGDRAHYDILPYRKNPLIAFTVTDKSGAVPVQLRADFLVSPVAQIVDSLTVQQVVLEISAAADLSADSQPALTIADLFASLPAPISIEGEGITAPFLRNDMFNMQMMVGSDYGESACTRVAMRHQVWYVVFAGPGTTLQNAHLQPWRGFRTCYDLNSD